MRNLLNFFLRFSTWFLLGCYVAVACALLAGSFPYQRHLWLTSAGAVASGLYDASANVTGYFHLRSVNDDLNRRTASLEEQVAALKEQLLLERQQAMTDSLAAADTCASRPPFRFLVATAINNSVRRPYNYITINRGSADGVAPEMGVMDQNGVVGIVDVVARDHARLISLLNPNFRLSCKLRGSQAFGSLVWDGSNPREALLEELPKHTRYRRGDTIVTSGYSAVFPEGIPVGVIVGRTRAADDNFFTLRIHLLTDFAALSTVKVITNRDIADIRQAEASTAPDADQDK